MIKYFFGAWIFLWSTHSQAVNELVLDPSPQSTKDTCQSYSIAYSLAHSGLWLEEVDTPKKLRELEQKIRSEIESIAKREKVKNPQIDTTTHTVWQNAVKIVSSNNLKLKLYYPSSPKAYYQKIMDITGITSADILGVPLSATLVKKPIMTSVTKLNGNTYGSGHIVTLLGLTAADNKPIKNMNKEIMVLNSAVKSNQKTFNMCSEEITSGDKKYSASVNITKDYELKDWGGKYLLMWIEKN